jgi:Phosphoesterase family
LSPFAAYHYGMFSRRKFLQIAAASSGIVITGTDLLNQAVANASPAVRADGSRGIRHIVILMMENRSFDHFLGWLPGADGRHDMTFVSAVDGNTYPNYPLAPDFQGCGYSDPDHSWEGWLVEYNYGKMNGFLQRPGEVANAGVIPAKANTFPIGYYTNFHHNGTRKAVPDLPVIGALAEHYTTLDRYFCAIAAETYPNRFYQHAAQTDSSHTAGSLPSAGMARICPAEPSAPARSAKYSRSSASCAAKSAGGSPSAPRRSARAVALSVPGARPIPRSIRPGCIASSVPNCSATVSGAWLGSITPPEPTRIADVADAIWPARTAGAALAMPGMLWCSAIQYRRSPHRSACRARSTLRRSASPADPPVGTGHRSSADRGTEIWALTTERLPERA